MNDVTSKDASVALALFVDLEVTQAAELAAAEAALPEVGDRTQHDERPVERTRDSLRQVRERYAPVDGTYDPRVDALVRNPIVSCLRLVAPGIATITRLRDRMLEQEQAAEKDNAESTAVRRYKYVGPVGKHRQDGRVLKPGDVVQLTGAQYEAFADRFDLVQEG